MAKDKHRDEQDLVSRSKGGDAAAMESLYHRHVGYLAAVCQRYIVDSEDVKDVLQDSFLKIFSSMATFEYRGDGSLRAWMARIVLNETLKFVRRNFRIGTVALDDGDIDVAEDEPDIDRVPMSAIHQMIMELPAGYRTIFNLYVFEEKTHKEIASMLGIKESTSASQLHRAKAMLADKIRRYQNSNSVSR